MTRRKLRKNTAVVQQKFFRFEVDQSIRIEQMNIDSFLAIANKESSFVLKIPRRAKRQVREFFRRQGKPKQFAPHVFAAVLVLAMKKSKFRFQELVIDIEYLGYEEDMMVMVRKIFPKVNIDFKSVGKKSPAHFAAYGGYIRKRKADGVVGAEEMLKIIKK